MEHWALHFHLQLFAERLQRPFVRPDRIFHVLFPPVLLRRHIDDSRARALTTDTQH